nr:molybdopterin-dependent oxidoreductase [Myxococcota bacterium]
AVMRWTAGLDARGEVLGVRARIASPGLTGVDGSDGELDPLACDGAIDSEYRWPASRVEWRGLAMPVRVGIWRSVGHSYNAFAVEALVDELALAAGRDPVAMRRALLGDRSRLRAVLDRAAERAGWGGPIAPGRARGVAAHACFGSFVAQVAEVSIEGGRTRVHRVTCAVDCGRVINPNIVRQQIEGGIAFGLSAALHGGIDVEDGRVVQSNFSDQPILRIDEMPEVVVEILASEAAPSGVGELAVPVIAPAVANALAALGAPRLRILPMRSAVRD